MMALIYPERLSEILQAWVNAYKEGGWFPQFPCPGYRNCMTGSPTDFVFGDAVARGITGFDVQAAFEGLKKHATQPVAPKLGYGRPAVAEYLKLGRDAGLGLWGLLHRSSGARRRQTGRSGRV
jgi:putative alpha-1,2-mannosidase